MWYQAKPKGLTGELGRANPSEKRCSPPVGDKHFLRPTIYMFTDNQFRSEVVCRRRPKWTDNLTSVGESRSTTVGQRQTKNDLAPTEAYLNWFLFWEACFGGSHLYLYLYLHLYLLFCFTTVIKHSFLKATQAPTKLMWCRGENRSQIHCHMRMNKMNC
jgi:hypothetical protein